MSVGHAALTGLNLHQPFHYIQETDPGAVGAGLFWFKKSTKTINYRNDTNTGWITILASSNVNALAVGTTWTEFQTAYDNTDPGDTIDLPNDVILQEAQMQMTGSAGKSIRIRGSGPNSEIRAVHAFTSPTAQFRMGFGDPTQRIEFLDFKISHDRAEMGPSARVNAIKVFGGTYNLFLERIAFQDITSSCVSIANEGWVETDPAFKIIDGVHILDCTVDEWYESVLDVHEINETVKNIYCERNICTTSEAHPDGSVSKPYGTYISVEEDVAGGFLENLMIRGNQFICAMPSNLNSVGVRFKRTLSPEVRYHRCYVIGNRYENWFQQFGTAIINTENVSTPGDAFIYVYGNTFYGGGAANQAIADLHPISSGTDVTTVYFGDNDIFKGAAVTAISNAPSAPATVVLSPDNRITDI